MVALIVNASPAFGVAGSVLKDRLAMSLSLTVMTLVSFVLSTVKPFSSGEEMVTTKVSVGSMTVSPSIGIIKLWLVPVAARSAVVAFGESLQAPAVTVSL